MKIFRYIIAALAGFSLATAVSAGQGPEGEAFLKPLQKRDSVLIADQLSYGFELHKVPQGTEIALPDYSEKFVEGVEIVRSWKVDTLSVSKVKGSDRKEYDLSFSVILTSFDEGEYDLPPIYVKRTVAGGSADTLVFSPRMLDVRTMPVDTASFQVHDIKGQAVYPVTFREILPYLAGALLVILLAFLSIWLCRKFLRKNKSSAQVQEPANIVALRKLDKFRGNKFWTAENQKLFYTGVTDALREYIAARYDIAAMEMTTAEIFQSMDETKIPQELHNGLKNLFETSDFVKFAKLTVSDEENSKVVPFAVRFVSETWLEVLEEEEKKDVL